MATVTEICNMALGRIGSNRLVYAGTTETDLDNAIARATDGTTTATLEAIQCNLYFWPTVDSLLRSYEWTFASGRATLALDTETPEFEWDYQYKLPEDYLRMKGNYGEDDDYFTIEGGLLLTNDSEVQIRYVKKITDPKDFTDPLFIEILVLQLALKLIPSLAGTKSETFTVRLEQNLIAATRKAVTVNKQETKTTGRNGWNLARFE